MIQWIDKSEYEDFYEFPADQTYTDNVDEDGIPQDTER